MNNFHEQAMSFVYQQMLNRLLGFFSRTERIALQLLIQRLLVAAGGVEQIGDYRVMVVHEGGKESTYSLAFLRAAQLSIAARTDRTFELRMVVLCQPRVTLGVMASIQAQCAELFMYEDRRVELLLVDESGAQQLRKPVDFERPVARVDRAQVLMSGHLSQGDARATFLYGDLLARARLFSYACQWGGEVNALIDRRPPTHLSQYMTWIQRVACQRGHAQGLVTHQGFATTIRLCSQLADDHKHGLRLPATDRAVPEPARELKVINVFDCLCGEVQVLHSQVLMFVEGVKSLQPLAIDEPQVAVVIVAAHVQGLRGVWQHGVPYTAGVTAYLQQVTQDNQYNERFKGQLIKHLRTAFKTTKKMGELRLIATQYLNALYGLNDEHLRCLIHSPFVHKGRALSLFLQQCYPEKLHLRGAFQQLLAGAPHSMTAHAPWLESVSGLPLASLQALYRLPAARNRGGDSVIGMLWAHDPNTRSRCSMFDSDGRR